MDCYRARLDTSDGPTYGRSLSRDPHHDDLQRQGWTLALNHAFDTGEWDAPWSIVHVECDRLGYPLNCDCGTPFNGRSNCGDCGHVQNCTSNAETCVQCHHNVSMSEWYAGNGS